MKYWTFQDKSVMQQLQRGEMYIPDFSMSTYFQADDDSSREMYYWLLEKFNTINSIDVNGFGKGLIFAFIAYDYHKRIEIGPGEFPQFLVDHRDTLEQTVKHFFAKPDTQLLQVEFEANLL